MSGNFVETFIVSEVLKFKYNRNAQFEMYFYRDSHGNEIDLILEFGNRYLLFEIKKAVTLRMEHARAMKKVIQFFPKSKSPFLGLFFTEMIETIRQLFLRNILTNLKGIINTLNYYEKQFIYLCYCRIFIRKQL